MAGTKISAATDAVTLNATDKLPIAREASSSKFFVTGEYISTYIGTSTTARSSAALTKNTDTVLANIPGLTRTVVPGTYRFNCVLSSTVASGTAGIKYAFNYTTTVLSSLTATSTAWVAAGTGCQAQTSTTTQAVLYGQAAAIIKTVIDGTMVVTTGGTIDLQMAQQVSNGSDTTVNVGSSMEFVRIA